MLVSKLSHLLAQHTPIVSRPHDLHNFLCRIIFSMFWGIFFIKPLPHTLPLFLSVFIPQNLTSTHSDDDDGEYKLTFTPFAAFVLSP